MRILVAGGAGFIGSSHVRALLDGQYPGYDEARVTIVDQLTYAGNLANLATSLDDPRCTFVHGDICDARLLADVAPGHDVVLNFAAETHVDRSIAGAPPFIRTNVLGTQTLMQACLAAGVDRVVQISTDEVYGSVPAGACSEEHQLNPSSAYAAAKAAGDLIAHSYARTHGLDVCVTRCSNNYGPYQFPEKVIPRFVTNLLDGRKVQLFGDGLHLRDWLHVDDHCRGIQIVLDKGSPGETYHVGGGVELTNRELTEQLLAACGAGWDMVEYVEDRKGHDRRYALDDTKLRSLGYESRVSFSEGVAATVQWYRDNRDWWEPLKESAELGVTRGWGETPTGMTHTSPGR